MGLADVALLVTLATGAPAPAADVAAITAVEADFAAAWAAHDATRMAGFWLEDGDLMNPFGRFARGRNEVESLFAEEQRGVMRASSYRFSLESSRALAPDLVVTDWTNVIHGMLAPNGDPLPPFTHHVTTVFLKRNGRWWKSAARSVALLPPPGGPTAAAPAAAELTRLLHEFLAGASRNDAAVHERFWADDLIYTGSSGRRVGKPDILRDVRGAAPPAAAEPQVVYSAEDVRIQQYGDTAVVAFRLVAATSKDAKAERESYLNTGTFVRRDGWQAVSWQATRVPPAEAAPAP